MRSFVLTSAILLATTSPLAVAAKPGTAQPDGSRFVAGDCTPQPAMRANR